MEADSHRHGFASEPGGGRAGVRWDHGNPWTGGGIPLIFAAVVSGPWAWGDASIFRTSMTEWFKTLFDNDFFGTMRKSLVLIGRWLRQNPLGGAMLLISVGAIVWYFGLAGHYGVGRDVSALGWMASTWNQKSGYDHGLICPFLITALILLRVPAVAAQPCRPSTWMGVTLIAIGVVSYLVGVRTIQWRIAVGGLPFIVLGGIAFVHSAAAARAMFFPVFSFYFFIHMPGLQQATNGLQIFATKAAFHIGRLFGVEAIVSGNQIIPANKPGFDIAEGCSGMRSLMALTLISAVYAHLTQKTLWKKIVLFACSLPLAILGNCLRIASILVIAEYVSYDFAAKAYHEWSGFVFFLVIGLSGLIAVDWLLNRGQSGRVVVRKVGAAVPEAGAVS